MNSRFFSSNELLLYKLQVFTLGFDVASTFTTLLRRRIKTWLVKISVTNCTQKSEQVQAEFRIVGWNEQGLVKDFKFWKQRLAFFSS